MKMPPKNASNRGIAWHQSEVHALLDIWADQEIQEQLAGRLHNMCVYDKISRKLKELGFNRTGEQCREKIKKLRRDYKTVVDNNYSPAFARRLLGFYDKVHNIFGKSSTEKPPQDSESITLNDNLVNLDENNCDLFQLDIETELLGIETLNSSGISNVSDNSLEENYRETSNVHTSDDINNDITKEFTRDEIADDIYKNYEKLQDSLINKHNSLHKKFIELEKERFAKEIEREEQSLFCLQKETRESKAKELEFYTSLLQLLAAKKRFSLKI